jgi:hypothetical protein
MKRYLISARSLLVLLGALVLAGVAIVPASGSTVSSHSGSLRTESQYLSTPRTHYFYTELGDGDTETFPCTPTNYGYSYPLTPIVIGANSCGVRVRLYEFIGQRGWNICFSPGQTKSVPADNQYPNEVYIGTSISPC